jgi:hypothetical protein
MPPELDRPDPILDEQDVAEAFDEDATAGDDRLLRERPTFEELPEVFDATRAVGDSDDEDALIGDDMDDDEIIASEEDGDNDDLEDDDLLRRTPEHYRAAALDDDDEEADDEVELAYMGDLENVDAAGFAATDLESDELSDEDLEELDYKERPTMGAREEEEDRPADPPLAVVEARTDEDDEVDPHQDELLDEGVEETFPASDPVSVKRIT